MPIHGVPRARRQISTCSDIISCVPSLRRGHGPHNREDHPDRTGTAGAKVPLRTPSLEPALRSSSSRYRMTNNNPRPLLPIRQFIAIASACAVVAVLAAHHPVARRSIGRQCGESGRVPGRGRSREPQTKARPCGHSDCTAHRPASARGRAEPEIGGGVERESATPNRISPLHAEPVSRRPVAADQLDPAR